MAVTQARLSRYRADLDDLGEAARSFMVEFIRATVANNPGMSVAELREETIGAVDSALYAFGDQASSLALGLFDEIVVDGHGLDAETVIEDVIDPEMIEGGVRYSARRLVEGDTEAFARDVADLTRYYIKRSAMENMVRNCDRNDLRYARVPSGRETCAFCFMLSSRGFVYKNEKIAGSAHSYHENCDCVIVPGFEGLPAWEQVEGYDPDGMRERWYDCESSVDWDAAKERWASMDTNQRGRYKGDDDRERYASFVNAQIRREVETRDWRWLYTGEKPRVSYASRKLALEIEQGRPWEKRTADILSENGFKCEFIIDREEIAPGQFIGLPDLADGVELKTLVNAKGKGAIDRHLRDAAHKKGLRCCVIDNSDGVLSDQDCIDAITEKMRKRGVSNVLFVDSSKGVHRYKTDAPKGP